MTGSSEEPASGATSGPATVTSDDDLIDRARYEDARHWATHQRPISAETLRKNLHISAARSRMLVSIVRAERSGDPNRARGSSWSLHVRMIRRRAVGLAGVRHPFDDQGGQCVDRLFVLLSSHRHRLDTLDHAVLPTAPYPGIVTHTAHREPSTASASIDRSLAGGHSQPTIKTRSFVERSGIRQLAPSHDGTTAGQYPSGSCSAEGS
jgi:hypothetical protein